MKRILIVEDIVETLRWLVEIVRSAYPAATICTANSVRTALSKLDGQIDLALIDLGLPDGSGLEILRGLNKASPSAIKVVTTVMGDDASIVSSLGRGGRVSAERDRGGGALSSADTAFDGVTSDITLCRPPHHGTLPPHRASRQPGRAPDGEGDRSAHAHLQRSAQRRGRLRIEHRGNDGRGIYQDRLSQARHLLTGGSCMAREPLGAWTETGIAPLSSNSISTTARLPLACCRVCHT